MRREAVTVFIAILIASSFIGVFFDMPIRTSSADFHYDLNFLSYRIDKNRDDIDDRDTVYEKHVLIPRRGAFEVEYVYGASFSLLDNDATDGFAKVQFPGFLYDVYIKATVKPEEDDFYNVNVDVDDDKGKGKPYIDYDDKRYFLFDSRLESYSLDLTVSAYNNKIHRLNTDWYPAPPYTY